MTQVPIVVLLAVLVMASFHSALRISSSKDIEVDTLTSSDHLFVELKQLKYFPKKKKISFITEMIEKYPDDLLVFKATEEGVELSKNVKFTIMKNLNYTYA